jgi:alkanesulfonate monooxygenase SsuD/methylene tetrahydromethanopterin reductase-like flavin-dependent oxidoreductase (luciferase family)
VGFAEEDGMRIGVGLPFKDQQGQPLDAAGLGQRARWIEEAGLDAAWMGDASFRRLATWPDPMMWLLTVGAATSRIEVGTAIYQVPLRHPVDLAQQFLTMRALLGDRISLGVGPGSTASGYAAVGLDFEHRFKTFHANMDTIRRLMAGETVGAANLAPWPSIAGGPRFLLGAWHGGASLARAARDYDGWLCSAGRTTVATIARGIKRYRDLGGTRAIVATCPVDLTAPDTPLADDEPFTLRCGPAQAAERLAWLDSLGFDDVMLNLRDPGATGPFESDITLEQLQRIRSLLPADTRPPATSQAPAHSLGGTA